MIPDRMSSKCFKLDELLPKQPLTGEVTAVDGHAFTRGGSNTPMAVTSWLTVLRRAVPCAAFCALPRTPRALRPLRWKAAINSRPAPGEDGFSPPTARIWTATGFPSRPVRAGSIRMDIFFPMPWRRFRESVRLQRSWRWSSRFRAVMCWTFPSGGCPTRKPICCPSCVREMPWNSSAIFYGVPIPLTSGPPISICTWSMAISTRTTRSGPSIGGSARNWMPMPCT